MKTLNINTSIRSLTGSLTGFLPRALWLTALLALTPICSHAETELLDHVVAIVDDDVVLASELEDRINQVKTGLQKAGRPAPPEDVLRSEVLDQLILENIQLQMAYRAGARVTDAQLNEAMQRIATQNGLNLAQFKQALEADGLSYAATREQIRSEMLITRVQQGNVNQRVQISEQEIDNFLSSGEGQSLTAPEFRLLHTLVPLPAGADDAAIEKARQFAQKLYRRIQQGESYEHVTGGGPYPYSLSTTDLGWRKSSDLPSLLTDLTTTLSEGETAEPLQSASGFHLVKMQQTRGAGKVITQTRARHILLKTSAIRDDAATRQQLADLRQRILNGEDFAQLAREYSEDIGSAQEGGELGWTSPGQLVSAFQTTLDNTEIDAISPVFRSEFGWHILQVLERRQKDVTDNIRQKIAHNFLHQRKFDDELQAWLQKIRDEAYVDIK